MWKKKPSLTVQRMQIAANYADLRHCILSGSLLQEDILSWVGHKHFNQLHKQILLLVPRNSVVGG